MERIIWHRFREGGKPLVTCAIPTYNRKMEMEKILRVVKSPETGLYEITGLDSPTVIKGLDKEDARRVCGLLQDKQQLRLSSGVWYYLNGGIPAGLIIELRGKPGKLPFAQVRSIYREHRARELFSEGVNVTQVANAFSLSKKTVKRWLYRYENGYDLIPSYKRGFDVDDVIEFMKLAGAQ